MSPSVPIDDDKPAVASSGPEAVSSRRPELLDLDLDELSPLPPAQGFSSNSRPASIERLSSLKHDAPSRPEPLHAVAPSPALSAAPSSFRLEGSPASSSHPVDTFDQLPSRPRPSSNYQEKPTAPPAEASPSRPELDINTNLESEQVQQQHPSLYPTLPPSASYVTVSAILSRSEMYYAPETSDQWDILRSPHALPTDARQSHDPYTSEQFGSSRRRRSQRKRPSNGSAIEALGALLLRKDSSGRVANLSFVRENDDSGVTLNKSRDRRQSQSTSSKRGTASKQGLQTWTSALGSFGKKKLRLQLPQSASSQASLSRSGATIAERRAQMWHQVLTRQGAVVEGNHDGFSKVRSRRGGLSFEVGKVNRKQTPSSLLQLNNYTPHARGKQRLHSSEEKGQDEPQSKKHLDTNGASSPGFGFGPLPDTIVLKAGRRPKLTQTSKSEFGIGSAYHDHTLPEAPPSPVAMPGAWQGGSSWRSKPGDGYKEGALVLPPPLLDDHGSDASSFEGLLGVRRMREREKARKQAEKLAARNRPAHKVGPLTALTNFVKAAHAAETSAKRAQGYRRFDQPPAFLRSYTQPAQLVRSRSGSAGSASRIKIEKSPVAGPNGILDGDASSPLTADGAGAIQAAETDTPMQIRLDASPATAAVASDVEVRKSPAVTSASPFLSAAARRAVPSRRGSRNNSVDAAGRQLNTVFESEPLDPSQIPDDELASPDLPPISSPLLRPSSRGSSKSNAFRDFPAAPRLLPVQLSMPSSPFTPLAPDHRSMGPPTTANGDYLSARYIHSAPRTPQLPPTMLSLPSSPWTPYGEPSGLHAPPMVHLHLNTSSSSLRLPPGTPRLVPTHIEVLPSPFPTSAASRRGSLTYDSPSGLRAIGSARSPLTGATTDFTAFSALRDAETADAASKSATEVSKVADAKRGKSNGSLRLTPSSMLIAAQSRHDFDTASGQRDAGDAETPTSSGPKTARKISDGTIDPQKQHRPSQSTTHVDSSGRTSSFILWFLIGDLGLRNRSPAISETIATSNGADAEADYGGLVAIVSHTFGLVVFILAHLVDLAYATYERVSLVLWFLRWMVYNLTGQTVLAQCVIEAYSFIQAEWATVAVEDHEEKGPKKKADSQGHRKPKGLSQWQVMRGLLELYCLHSVTRERYLAEGAGLQALEGWTRPSRQDHNDRVHKPRGPDRVDIAAHHAASRAALGEKRRSWAQQNGTSALSDDNDVHGHPNVQDWAGNGHGWSSRVANGDNRDDNSFNPNEDNEAYGEEEEEEEDESSEGEMVVTNRGDDILEFAKTPRLDAARPGQASTGYFGRVYDFMTSPQVGASQPGATHHDLRAFKESNRDLVRTIKWCGLLAISAYGLHVHIVDLPPTFTPSGDRFSRQTFAYLSRLNADDVLHADIQTLDADADYSPTFYVVRDYIRKVVCVAVRGTQSFSDIIVDLELQTEEIELPQVQPTPGEEFRCHAGIWRAAKVLVSPQSKLFATLCQALAENEGFGVMFCGHSLGGAIASAAALLLAEYFIPDGAEPDSGTWVTNMSSGLPARRPIRAVSFASPVTMTADLATRAAMGSVPLVTTVVLGSDVIPRVGHGQVRELRRVLGALARVRRRHAMASSEGQDDAHIHILRSYWDWRSISMAEDADDVMLHRKERIEEQLWSLRREVESDLYAAIKARLDTDSTAGSRIPPSPWIGPQQRDEAPLHALAARRQELDSATLRSEAAQGGPLIPPGRCIWINNKQVYHVESPLAFFSLPELRSDMFAAHFPAAYEEAILELRT
ncbi:hypothetical protein NDA18_005340 [Ustilago nuda]|nr:hypothetical protein NDA18_005340 [Ustilago nuda]